MYIYGWLYGWLHGWLWLIVVRFDFAIFLKIV
jgi:hypothetical protein